MQAQTLSGLRILLLEDEYLIAMDVELLCRDHGAGDVAVRRSLGELEKEDPGEFDVAIIDIMLSGQSTLPFARRLMDEGRPFVFASGYVDARETLNDFPGVPVVQKPYAGTDLIEAVAAAARR